MDTDTYLIEVSVARRYRVAAENRYEAEEIAIAYFAEGEPSLPVEEEALAEIIEDYGGLVDATLDAKGILLGGEIPVPQSACASADDEAFWNLVRLREGSTK